MFCRLLILLLALSGLVRPVLAAKALLDNEEIYSGETVQLTLLAEGEWAGTELDLQALGANFRILGMTTGTQLRAERGRVRSRTRWALHLEPKRTGELSIPPIIIGEEQTPTLTLTVKPEDVSQLMAASEVFVETVISPQRPYVQAQILYTVRIRHTGNILEHSFIPAETGPELSLHPLGEERNYDAPHAGKTYHVIEQNYALFASKSGALRLPTVTFRARLFDPEDQHGTRPRNRRVNIATRPVTLQVRAKPPQFSAQHWLPSEHLQLQVKWPQDSSTLRVGEPVTVQLILEARGLRGFQLPPLNWPISDYAQAGLRSYPGTASTEVTNTADGFQLRRVLPITLVPTRPGTLQLPPWRLAWWDTQADQARLAELPLRLLQISPGATALSKQARVVGNIKPPTVSVWPFTAFGLLLLWLLTLWAWRRERPRPQPVSISVSPAAELPPAGLQQACLDNDPGKAAQTLLSWLRQHQSQASPASLGALARRWPQHRHALLELDRALYGRTRPVWDGQDFWQRVRRDLE